MKNTLKSILNATWKVGVGLFGLTVSVIGILVAQAWYESTYGRDYWKDKALSPEVSVLGYENNVVRVWNSTKKKYTTPKIRWVSGIPERDSLTVFCDKSGKRGWLNVKNGEIVIPAQYVRAWQFSEGLGAVLGENNKIGFIDSGNNLVIDYVIPYEKGVDYIFKDGYCVVPSWKNNEWRYIVYGKDGRQLLDGSYTRMDEPNDAGYRIIANESGHWLCDRAFSRVFDEPFDNLKLAEDIDGVFRTKDHVKQLVDFKGNVLEPFVIDGTYSLRYMVKYNDDEADEYELVPDLVVYRVDGWEGLMNKHTGRIITPAVYKDFTMISKDLIRAELDSDLGSGSVVMDKNGMILKP